MIDRLLYIVALLAVGVPTAAEIVHRADGGFTSEHVLHIHAAPVVVYRALTDEIDAWWDKNHSYGGASTRFTLEARPGGCFCERFGDGAVLHMSVSYVDPPRKLRLLGGLGPLQGMAAAGAMDFMLEASDDGAELTYRYVVSGYGVGELADAVDRVQLGQLQRLKRYVETGRPDEQ